MRKVGCSSCARISINLAAAVAVIALVRHIVDVGAPGVLSDLSSRLHKPPVHVSNMVSKLRYSAPDRRLRPALLRGTGVSFDEICLLHGTDKASTQHDFCNFYEAHLDMKQIRSVLEVGVKYGNSLRSWGDAIPQAQITGFTLDPKECTGDLCDNVEYTDQNDAKTLRKTIGDRIFDLIVDDGGHTMMQQQNTLGAYWSHVNPGGAFVMEDLHTSVLEKFQTPQWQNEGYGKTVDVLFDSPPPGLERMECNFKRDQIPKNDLQSQKKDHFGMTCILHKAK